MENVTHQSGQSAHKPAEPKKVKLGENLTLLDKTLAYMVSQRGANCYWGRVLNGCSIQVSVGYGTAGITLVDGGKLHAFIYDPLYFQDLTAANRRCTLVHEAVHVTCLHTIRYMRLMKQAATPKVRKAIRAVFNIAADMEDNDTYVRLEKDFQKTIEEGEFWHLPEQHGFPLGLSMEAYIDLLLKNLPASVNKLRQMAKEKQEGEEGGNGSPGGSGAGGPAAGGRRRGSGQSMEEDDRTDEEKASDTAKSVAEAAEKFENLIDELLGLHPQLSNDTHGQWMKEVEELAEKDPAKLEQLIELAQKNAANIVKSAYDTTVKLRGSVPGGVAQRLTAMLQQPIVPWTQLLRDWVMSHLGREFTDTMRTPSLALINLDSIEPYPGLMLEPEVNVTWITDTSGSMSDECFRTASSEMAHMIRQTSAIRVHHIQVDTVIQNETCHDQQDPDITAQIRYGYGGTVLAAAFARAVNVDLGLWRPGVEKLDEVRQPDLMVVYTDGYIEPMAEVLERYHPGCPTLWLISPGGQIPADVQRIGAPHHFIPVPRDH